MKIKKILIPVIAIMLISQVIQGQVLLSLLFGDKLNSPTLKFGLDGGSNFSTLSNISGSKYYKANDVYATHPATRNETHHSIYLQAFLSEPAIK
jgi:hypothetical protein